MGRSRTRLPARLPAWLPVLVLLAWILLTAAAVPLAGRLPSVAGPPGTVELPRDADATRVEALAGRFPDSDTTTAVVVYARAGGLTAADLAKIDADRVVLAGLAGAAVPPVRVAGDRAAAMVAFDLRPSTTATAVADDAAAVRQAARRGAPDGLDVRLSGSAGAALDARDASARVARTAMLVTALVVVVVLLVTYRSPVLWLLPLLNAGVAIVAADATMYLLGRFAGVTVDAGNAAVVTVLVFGVGTDYAMLLIARYREELRRTPGRAAAMASAWRGAAPAIAASAATVGLGLLCLLTADMGFNFALGPAGAVAVAAAFAVMVTLLPAQLVLLGRWVFWPAVPRLVAADGGAGLPGAGLPGDGRSRTGFTAGGRARTWWERVGAGVARRPRLVWLGSTLVLALLALGAAGARTGLDDQHLFAAEPESVVGQRLLVEHFGTRPGRPVRVVVPAVGTAAAGPAASVGSEPSVGSAASAGSTASGSPSTSGRPVAEVVAALRSVPGVVDVAGPVLSSDGRLARLDVTVAAPSGPPAPAGSSLGVDRALLAAIRAAAGPGALVGGAAAVEEAKAAAQAHDRRVVIPLVLLVVLAVLVLLLRAIVAPVLLVATVVLSYFAAVGAGWLVFAHVFGFQALDVQVMLVGFLFLVALGVDYNIFLVSRIRQETLRVGHRDGVLRGLAVTGGVVTSAGLVLAATFAVLLLAPLVAFVEIGFVVALGVLIDTLLVRSLVVPALALDLGPRFWWPSHRLMHGGPQPPR